MDSDLQREIDARSGEEIALFIHMQGQDSEAAAYAAKKLIKIYAEAGRHGALLNLSARLPKELEGMAELAIVDSIPLHGETVPGKPAKKYGIIEDLAFDRKMPEGVRIAAGKKKVDILLARMEKGDASAKKEIEEMSRHRRSHRDVKIYARNSLDAQEIAKQKQSAFRAKKAKPPRVQMPQKPVAAAQAKLGGSYIP
jgi:hypothetical protein